MNDFKRAALRNLPQSLKFGPTATSFELDSATSDQLEAQQNRIREWRVKVSRIEDPKARAAYNYWLDFFQEENDRAREEMITQARKTAWKDRQKQREIEDGIVSELAQSLPKP